MYALLAAIALGMTASCFRWLFVDQIHALTGVAVPVFNARALQERPSAFTYLVENHYRYYQFYANTLVSIVWTYSIHRWLRTSTFLRFGTDLAVLVLCAVLFAGSRVALTKYRSRSGQLIGEVDQNDWKDEPMTNGIDHNQGNGGTSKPRPRSERKSKPAAKPDRKVPAEKGSKQSAS